MQENPDGGMVHTSVRKPISALPMIHVIIQRCKIIKVNPGELVRLILVQFIITLNRNTHQLASSWSTTWPYSSPKDFDCYYNLDYKLLLNENYVEICFYDRHIWFSRLQYFQNMLKCLDEYSKEDRFLLNSFVTHYLMIDGYIAIRLLAGKFASSLLKPRSGRVVESCDWHHILSPDHRIVP